MSFSKEKDTYPIVHCTVSFRMKSSAVAVPSHFPQILLTAAASVTSALASIFKADHKAKPMQM